MSRRLSDGAVRGALVGLFAGVVPACRYAYLLDRHPGWPLHAGPSVIVLWLPFVACGAAIGLLGASFVGERVSPVIRTTVAGRLTAIGGLLIVLSPALSAIALAWFTDAAREPGESRLRLFLPHITLGATFVTTLVPAVGGFLLRGGLLFRTAAALSCSLAGYLALPVAVALILGPR